MDKIEPVKPGDLITADFIDRLLLAMQELDTRVSKLEQSGGSGGVVISSVTPQDVTVKGTLTVSGSNFSKPTSFNIVTLGGKAITQFKDLGSEVQFAFEVPALDNLAPNGSSELLVVTNAQGKWASFPVTVRPFVAAPSGSITVSPAIPVDPGMVASPDSVRLTFTLSAQATLDADYSATLSSPNPSFQPKFIPGSNDTVSQDGTILSFRLAGSLSGASKTVTVKVDVAAGVANGGASEVRLDARCTNTGNTVQAGNRTLSLAVGSPIPSPEVRASVALTAPTATSGTVVFTRNNAGVVAFNLNSTVDGLTTATITMRDDADWQASSPTKDIPVGNGKGNWPFQVTWKPGANAVDTDMLVTVKNSSPVFSVTYVQPVAVKPPRVNG